MNFMQLDKRQQILAGILVGTVILMFGVPTVWGIVFGPFNERYGNLAALEERLEKKQEAQEKLENAVWKLKESDRRSLPADPSSLGYQVWLTDLAKKHDFNNLSVSPKPSSRNGNEPFSRIRIAMTAQCQMRDLCRFLFDFYRADLMHKVVNLAVKSLSSKNDPELEISVDIEGLSMQSTKKRTNLFEGKQEQSVSKAMAKRELSEFESLYTKNPFVRGYNGPPKPATPPAPPPAPFDSSPFVKYVGFVEVDGVGEGWLYDQTANKNTVLKTGSEFEVAGIKATVIEVAPDFVILNVKEKRWRLEQGESLKQLRELTSDGKSIAAPTTPTAPDAKIPDATVPTAGNSGSNAANPTAPKSGVESPVEAPADPKSPPTDSLEISVEEEPE